MRRHKLGYKEGERARKGTVGMTIGGNKMTDNGFGEGIRKILLAGVGAVAIGAEKSQELVEELVKKGELTVEQGKILNEELTRKASKAANETQDSLLRMYLEGMSPEERAAYAKRVSELSSEIDAGTTTVEVESDEKVADDEPAEEAETEKAEEAE